MDTVTEFVTAEFTRRPDDATCWRCGAQATALTIGSTGTRFAACTGHTLDALAAALDD